MIDSTLYINLLRTTSLTASILGILAGLDILFGSRILALSKELEKKHFDFDKWIKKVLERTFDFDRIITKPEGKKALGIAFLVLSIIMLLLIKRV